MTGQDIVIAKGTSLATKDSALAALVPTTWTEFLWSNVRDNWVEADVPPSQGSPVPNRPGWWLLPDGDVVKGPASWLEDPEQPGRWLVPVENHNPPGLSDLEATWTELASEKKRALEKLIADIKKDEAKRAKADELGLSLTRYIRDRMATLIACDGVSSKLVFSYVAEALQQSVKAGFRAPLDFDEAYEMACEPIDNLLLRKEPVQPFYYDFEYDRMSGFVHQGLSARMTEYELRELYNNPRLSETLDAVIQGYLKRCQLWDYSRNIPTVINKKIINEVRATLARNFPRWQAAAPNKQQTPITLSITAIATPVTEFANTELVLKRDTWTSSADLWAAWQAWFELNSSPSEAPIHQVNFFRSLMKWADGKIERSRRGADRVPGYAGIAMRQRG